MKNSPHGLRYIAVFTVICMFSVGCSYSYDDSGIHSEVDYGVDGFSLLQNPKQGNSASTALELSQNSSATSGDTYSKSRANEDAALVALEAMAIFFHFDSYQLDHRMAKSTLDQVARYMLAFPDWHLEIEGHCDYRGSKEYNLRLGERRVAEIVKYLNRKGIPENRLTAVSYGKMIPQAKGTSRNRRCTFNLLDKTTRLLPTSQSQG